MTVDELLTTTRSVRKRLDFSRPVSAEAIEECLQIAVQAPTGSNLQSWHFLVLTEEEPRRLVADAYRRAFRTYATTIVPQFPGFEPEDPRSQQRDRVNESAVYLCENMHRAPVLVLPCMQGRPEGSPLFVQAALWGSILPAA
ncbi:MAG: nitroreductase family protein, partial [Candidatus Eremiobacterota bacterium]